MTKAASHVEEGPIQDTVEQVSESADGSRPEAKQDSMKHVARR